MSREHRPSFSTSQAESIAAEQFALRAAATELPGDRDQNFKLATADGSVWVLKIAAAGVPPNRVVFENKLLEAAASGPLPMTVPSVAKSLAGADFVSVDSGEDVHIVRLLQWVDGHPLAAYRPHGNDLLEAIGMGLGRLSGLLGEIHDPGPPVAPDWDLRNAQQVVADSLARIHGSQRDLVERHFQRYLDHTAGITRALPTQTVFNDANDYNILVSRDHPWRPPSLGLIDFGDAQTSWRIADLAIASAYCMLDKVDPIEAAEAVARGFVEARPVSEEEADALFDLICMRLCVSVALSTRRMIEEPDNTYFQISAGPAWRLLGQLDGVHPRLARYRIRAALGLEPNPASASIRAWLRDNRGQSSPVCDVDLRSGRLTVLDLGPASYDPVIAVDEPTATRVIFDRIDADDHVAAIGRYDELRVVYSGEQFRHETNQGTEFRNVHIGIDVFRPPGSPVFAPLPGRVRVALSTAEVQGYGVVVVLEHQPDGCPPFFTLFGHLSQSDLEGIEVDDWLDAGERVGTIGRPVENGGWTPHLHFQIITDLLDYEDGFPGVAFSGQRDVWRSLSPDPNLMLQVNRDYLTAAAISPAEIAGRRARMIAPSLSLSYDDPLTIVRGAGTTLFDHNGRRYLDCVNNVCHVGHGNPHVVNAAARQMAVLNTNTRYLHENMVRYAERLSDMLPAHLDTFFFVNSGSEANDLAVRLARVSTGRSAAVVFEGAYHGHLSSLVRLSPYKFDGPGGEGRPDDVFVAPMPDRYRGRHRGDDAARAYAAGFQDTLAEADRSGGASMFLFEPMLSCGGQIDPPPGFLSRACADARQAGLICIADEVQIGFGRLGETFWGFERQGVSPDIVTMGKSIGNGHPLAAVATTREIANAFDNGMEYFNTFGGNPVSCAVGLAVLDVIERERLQDRALEIGSVLKTSLWQLAERHHIIGDVRGAGFFLGVELVADRETREPAPHLARHLVNRSAEQGVLLSTDGPDHNVIKIKPPMVFNNADASRLVATLDRIFGETVFQPLDSRG